MNLIDKAKCHILVIDMQENLLPSIHKANEITENTVKLLKAADKIGIQRSLSEHYVKGLGQTPETIRKFFSPSTILEKISFSCLGDEMIARSIEKRRSAGDSQILLCGMETHICILQTAFDLLKDGWEVFVIADASSARTQMSDQLGKERMRQAGVQIVTVEMVIFEWVEKAGTEDFKSILPLLK